MGLRMLDDQAWRFATTRPKCLTAMMIAVLGLLCKDAVAGNAKDPTVGQQSQTSGFRKHTYIDEFGQEQPMFRDTSGNYVQPGRTYVEIPVPPPIQGYELNRWAEILTLSEAQRLHLDRLYEEYTARELEYHDAHVQALWDEAADLVSSGSLATDVQLARDYRRLALVGCSRVSRALDAIERRLFDDLMPILSEDQLMRLDAVRRLRQRQRYQVPPRYCGTSLDLSHTLDLMERRGDVDVTPMDPEAFEELLYAYDVTLTSLVVRRGTQRTRLACDATVALAEIVALGQDGGDDLARSRTKNKLRNCRRRLLDLEKPIFDLNEEYIALLGELLPGDTAAELKMLFRIAVYPPVFPDPTNATPLLENATELETISPEQAQKVQAIRDWYGPTRRQICDQMCRRYLKWSEDFALEWGYKPEDFARYDRDMRGLHKQRMDLAKTALEQLRTILTDEQWEELADWREWFQKQLDREFNPDPRIHL